MADAGSVPSGEPPKGDGKAKAAGKQADTGGDALVGGPLMTVVVRNEFYRDGFRNLIKIAIVEAAIIVALIITFIAYIDTVRSQDHYFATTADGRIMSMTPQEYPSMSDSALLAWATQTASEVMTFGFNDYQRRLQYCSHNFTPQGWQSFTDALQKLKTIETMTALQQVISAEPSSAPIILQEGPFNGKYHWKVKLPLKVNYQSGSENRVDYTQVTVLITRVPELENPSGVGIEQWILTQPGAKD